MNARIREKRKISFQNAIITPAIIQRIARVIHIESENEHDKEGMFQNFSIDTFDNSSYESQSIGIFESGKLIDSKTLSKVQMNFYTGTQSKKIEVNLEYSTDPEKSNSYLLVSGDDSVWVNGVHSQIMEIIDDSEHTSTAGGYLFFVFIFSVVLFNYYYFTLFYTDVKRIKYGWIEGIMTLWPIIGGLVVISKAEKYLAEMYPVVELQTGPVHLQKAYTRRKKLGLLASLIIFPIITALIYDILKNWLKIIS